MTMRFALPPWRPPATCAAWSRTCGCPGDRAMTTGDVLDPERRSADLVLARLHLRVGSIAHARADLETLAGRAPLDDGALVDLAEARWRTGEIGLAGEAAVTAIEHGVEAPLALMIAAEAASALGRPGEARRLATRAMTAAGGTLDALFAGMPRSAVWPTDPAGPAPVAATLFGDDGVEPSGAAQENVERPPATPAVGGAAAAVVTDVDGPGLWDADADAPVAPPVLDPAVLMDEGMASLAAGDPGRAAALLGLAVRMGPHLAPAILDGTIDATQPDILLVRGDAFLAVGHATEAAAAYAASADALRGTAAPDASDSDAALQSGLTDDAPQ